MVGARAARRSALREEYVGRVNLVLDHIEQHLTDDLDLSALAQVAGFSRFHFHRIFASILGETPADFLHRIRVERAAAVLVAHPSMPITQIALECGFSGSAPFARAFRARFGMSASAWRAGGHVTWKDPAGCRAVRTDPPHVDDRFAVLDESVDPATGLPIWRMRVQDWEPVTVALRWLQSFPIAYVRHVGRYQGDGALFARLFGVLGRWAGPRELLADPDGWSVCVYHDDPNVTDDDRLRVTVGITVPASTATGGEIGSTTVGGGLYGVGTFRLRERDYADAWAAMVAGWLPESGCQLDDRDCFERFPMSDLGGSADDAGNGGAAPSADDPDDSDERSTPVEICLPVKPL